MSLRLREVRDLPEVTLAVAEPATICAREKGRTPLQDIILQEGENWEAQPVLNVWLP